jgi:hypothetical protein
LEIEKWNPSDGYGFDVELGPVYARANKRWEGFPQSGVKVLKLHGSVGWIRKKGSERPYLRSPNYLQYFYFQEIGCVKDVLSLPPGHGPDMNPTVIKPS